MRANRHIALVAAALWLVGCSNEDRTQRRVANSIDAVQRNRICGIGYDDPAWKAAKQQVLRVLESIDTEAPEDPVIAAVILDPATDDQESFATLFWVQNRPNLSRIVLVSTDGQELALDPGADGLAETRREESETFILYCSRRPIGDSVDPSETWSVTQVDGFKPDNPPLVTINGTPEDDIR